MFGDLTKNWGAFVVRGAFGVLFGLIGFLAPGITLAALIILFGAWALIDGIFAIVAAIRGQSRRPWWALVLRGIFGILAAAVAFLLPGITAVALVFVIAAWAIASGIVEIAAAIRLRKQIEGEWLLGLAGALSIALGVLLAANPGAGAIALLWLICSYAIIFGAVLIGLGLRLRSRQKEYERMTGGPPSEEPKAPPSGAAPSEREQRAAD